MENSDLLREITENLPMFFCAVQVDNGRILMLNQAAANLFGNIETIGEAGEGNTLLISAGDKVNGHFEYNSNIGGRWYWISHYSVTWTEYVKAEIFIGVDYGKLKNFSGPSGEMAFTETLKGPINALDRLENQVKQFKDGAADAFSVCYLDVNGVKSVNDALGEAEGDAYIHTVIKVVKSSIRKSDIFIHIGGDDFLLIFPKCSYAIVENIMAAAVKKLDIINIDNNLDCDYSVSYGIMDVNVNELADVDLIMQTIRLRMLDMKERSGVVC
ncbi:MAG: GTP cyclohydrolase IIa [Clostridiales bacterium]|jgi:diguanylate cyclase (GGDEF)-like protein|nr:GTP cyclohydrolase IIa [Clostridiales bacterium]